MKQYKKVYFRSMFLPGCTIKIHPLESRRKFFTMCGKESANFCLQNFAWIKQPRKYSEYMHTFALKLFTRQRFAVRPKSIGKSFGKHSITYAHRHNCEIVRGIGFAKKTNFRLHALFCAIHTPDSYYIREICSHSWHDTVKLYWSRY